MKSCADIKKIKSFHFQPAKKVENSKKEMVYPSKGSTYLDLKNSDTIAKIDQDKLKKFAEQLKYVFATKIELKNKDLEREIGNFLILNIQYYTP